MINHFNFKRIREDYLLTNDLGLYVFLDCHEFEKFVRGEVTSEDECYGLLRDNGFIFDVTAEQFIGDMAERLRSIKSYLFTGTSLHIFAVTNSCNMLCVYCQATDPRSTRTGMMTKETGLKAIEFALQSPASHLTFEFQGGEPLLNFETIKAMILHCEALCVEKCDKKVEKTIVTNLIALDDEKLDFLIEHGVSVCTSLDGSASVHDSNRRLNNGAGAFQIVIEKIRKVQKYRIPVGAIETTTRVSLGYSKEIIDTYLEMGIGSIFLRPMTPLGFAKSRWLEIGYSAEEYLDFYRQALEYILEINAEGRRFPEIHSTYFLKKIMGNYSDNYMELRSPCGAGIGQMSYYHDGSVYTCDEGRMLSEKGDVSFRLGNVHRDTYETVVGSSLCKTVAAASVVESLANCCDCAYQPYCGVCPVVAYAEEGDIFQKQPDDYRCKIYKGMLDILFGKIYDGCEKTLSIFRDWISE